MRTMLVMCAATVACLATFAQTTKRAGEDRPKVPVSEAGYANAEFDVTVTRLPARFKGHDIKRLFSALEKRALTQKKREFESTEQWLQRTRSAEAQPVSGGLLCNSTYAFVLEQGVKESPSDIVNVDYDADGGKFEIVVTGDAPEHQQYPGENRMYLYLGGFAMGVLREPSSHKTYIGSNGFGASRQVHAYDRTEYQVLIAEETSGLCDSQPCLSLPVSPKHKEFHITVPMSADTAGPVKKQLQVVVIGKLAVPFVSTGSSYRAPTVDDPVEVGVRMNYVKMDISAVWVYNRETGAVYARTALAEARRR